MKGFFRGHPTCPHPIEQCLHFKVGEKVKCAVIFGKEEAGSVAFIFLINLPTKEKKVQEIFCLSALYHKGILDLFQVDFKEILCSF